LRDSERLKQQEVQSGFIAQEVEQAANEVGYNFHGVDKPKNSTSHYGLRYAEFVVPMVKAIQEQQEQINALQLPETNKEQEVLIVNQQIEIDSLKEIITTQNERLERLEAIILKE
jgi:hypothetical protein